MARAKDVEETGTDLNPTITIIARDEYCTRYRIEGGEISPEWETGLRPGRSAWSEFTLYVGDYDRVASYGGEVWPTAWPALVVSTGTPEWPHGTAQSPASLRLTAVGRALIDAADAAVRS